MYVMCDVAGMCEDGKCVLLGCVTGVWKDGVCVAVWGDDMFVVMCDVAGT